MVKSRKDKNSSGGEPSSSGALKLPLDVQTTPNNTSRASTSSASTASADSSDFKMPIATLNFKYTYQGQPQESLKDFLAFYEAQFTQQHLPSHLWPLAIASYLEGEAATWCEENWGMPGPWDDFRNELIQHFTSTKRLQQFETHFLYDRQGPNETYNSFALQKKRLGQALGFTDERIANTIALLVREPYYTKWHEEDYGLEEIMRRCKAADTYRPAPETPSTSRPSTSTSAPAMAAPPSRQPTPPQRGPPRSSPPPSSGNRNLPECEYCPQRHYHRDCDVLNKFKRDCTQKRRRSEN